MGGRQKGSWEHLQKRFLLLGKAALAEFWQVTK